MLLWLGVRPTEIYTLVTLSFEKVETGEYGDWAHTKRSRLWNWFPTQEEAIESALRGADFYSECGYYTHIVVEKVSYRALPYDHNPVWFELRHLETPIREPYVCEDGETGEFLIEYEAVRVDKPKGTERIVGWGIG